MGGHRTDDTGMLTKDGGHRNGVHRAGGHRDGDTE